MTSIDRLGPEPSTPTSSPLHWPDYDGSYDDIAPGLECMDAPAPLYRPCDHAGWQALRDALAELVPAADLAAANARIAELDDALARTQAGLRYAEVRLEALVRDRDQWRQVARNSVVRHADAT